MKIEELKTLFKGKDLNSETAQEEILDAINSDINSVVKRKKESIAEELEDYKAKVAEANLNYKKAESSIKELTDKISEKEALLAKTNTKLYITGKAKCTLDEQALEDVITLAQKRVSKDKTNEQAIDEVLNLYFNTKQSVAEKQPEVQIKTVQSNVVKSQPIPRNAYPQSNVTGSVASALNKFKDTLHIGSLSVNKK